MSHSSGQCDDSYMYVYVGLGRLAPGGVFFFCFEVRLYHHEYSFSD